MPSAVERHLTWDNFERNFCKTTGSRLHRIVGATPVDLFTELNGAQMGLRVPVEEGGTPQPALAGTFEVVYRTAGGQLYIEIRSSAEKLRREFYYLMLVVADLVQLDGIGARRAVDIAVQQWRALLEQSTGTLTRDGYVGLFGELWTLIRMMRSAGPSAVDSWVGPLREPHDFRYAATEVEVKTTTTARRVHRIAGLEQLTPSSGHRLFLLSLQLAPAGGAEGRRVLDLANSIRERLKDSPDVLAAFEDKLGTVCGERVDDAIWQTKYVQRSPARLVPVDTGCPQITRGLLANDLREAAARIVSVDYDVDIEGLGTEDGEVDFNRVLP